MKNNKTIIDVRTPMEFMGGHVTGSINIPLNEIPQRVEEIKKWEALSYCAVPVVDVVDKLLLFYATWVSTVPMVAAGWM